MKKKVEDCSAWIRIGPENHEQSLLAMKLAE